MDRTVRWYEECWHDLLFEPEYQDVTDTAIRYNKLQQNQTKTKWRKGSMKRM